MDWGQVEANLRTEDVGVILCRFGLTTHSGITSLFAASFPLLHYIVHDRRILVMTQRNLLRLRG
jgi:hypothetical protein